jgi:cyclopropane-fatty-acyl-phospholipid synthase
MGKQFSIQKAATRTAINSKPSILAKIFKKLIITQFKKINYGCIILNENNSKVIFGDEGSKLKTEVNIYSDEFYILAGSGGDLGIAEAFAAGYWDAVDMVTLIQIVIKNQEVQKSLEGGLAKLISPINRYIHRSRRNTVSGSKENIVAHYDLSNEFFQTWLDKSMTYSCAIFEPQNLSLFEASKEKLDRICRKLNIQAGDHVVEIGAGWGSFALHAVKEYGCRVTTTTISNEQHAYVSALIEKEGLKDKITLLKNDYRELKGQYDKLVSIEMIEAVGYNFIQQFFQTCSDLLKPNGLMAIQGITYHEQGFENHLNSVDFIKKYIFPGSNLISVNHVLSVIKNFTDLSLVHLEDITKHYAETLKLWREKYKDEMSKIKKMGYSDEFLRMWDYYFIYCEAGFRERFIGDVQLIMSKPKNKNIQINY